MEPRYDMLVAYGYEDVVLTFCCDIVWYMGAGAGVDWPGAGEFVWSGSRLVELTRATPAGNVSGSFLMASSRGFCWFVLAPGVAFVPVRLAPVGIELVGAAFLVAGAFEVAAGALVKSSNPVGKSNLSFSSEKSVLAGNPSLVSNGSGSKRSPNWLSSMAGGSDLTRLSGSVESASCGLLLAGVADPLCRDIEDMSCVLRVGG